MRTHLLKLAAFIAVLLNCVTATAGERHQQPSLAKGLVKGMADSLSIANTSIAFGDKVLLHDMEISIAALDSTAIPELDYGMSNVSIEGEGYRFLPHGTHFNEDGATVRLKYDRTRIPSGYTEDDIRTYYYDTERKAWVALQLVEVDKLHACVVSKTTHFTDMINGVIVAPESPETSAFTPTMMNDIKAADPTSKINIIMPPTANNRGSANLTYPFEMPPARNGMQPQIGLSYNSDGGSGWAGEGWDISVPAITVDTRWGVPRYSNSIETETYLLNGQMLAMMNGNEMTVAHRTNSIQRLSDRQFFLRQGGDFNLIVRKTSRYGTYYWEVTDRNGLKYVYGDSTGSGNGELKGQYTDISGNQREVIAEWKLTSIEEPHGDYIKYIYNSIDENSLSSVLATKAIYLSQINVGNAGEEPHTRVTFTNQDTTKTIKTYSARYGFLTSSSQLLDSVLVEFVNNGTYEKMRSYKLCYENGAFYKKRLKKISHRDNFDNEVAYQIFDYYNDVCEGPNFVPYESDNDTISVYNDSLNAGFLNPLNNSGNFSDDATAIGGTKSQNTGVSVYAGIGINDNNMGSKSNTGGVSFSYSYSSATGVSTLIDIDGDGVPDKVFAKDGALKYRSSLTADSIITINGIKNFLKTTTHTTGAGYKFHPSLFGITYVTGKDYSYTKSKTDTYFTDVNGDGLIDIVSKGKVYFNCTEDENGILNTHFSLSSAESPSPILNYGTIDSSETEATADEIENAVVNSPMIDMVRVWVAPYDGTVRISGNVEILPPQVDDEDGADGIYFSIQHDDIQLKLDSIVPNGTSLRDASISQCHVTKGDKIFFRLQSGRQRLSNGSSDRVTWNPIISYIGKTNYLTPNNHYNYIFDSKESEVVSDTTIVPFRGTQSLMIKGYLDKSLTSDTITLRVFTSSERVDTAGNPLNYTRHLVYQQAFSWNDEYCDSLSFPITYHANENNIECEVYSTSNIAWDKIKWTPVLLSDVDSIALPVAYSIYADNLVEGAPVYVVANEAVTIGLQGMVYNPTEANGYMMMTVKSSNGQLYGKNLLHIVDGHIINDETITITPTENGYIWVELFTDNRKLAEAFENPITSLFPPINLSSVCPTLANHPVGPYAVVQSVNSQNMTGASVNLFTKTNERRFGPLYRGWGQFAYNTGSNNRYAAPIDTSLLKLNESNMAFNDTLDVRTIAFSSANPDIETQRRWYGPNRDVFITGTTMGASRLGEKDVALTNPLENIAEVVDCSNSKWEGTNARGIPLISYSTSNDSIKEFGAFGVSVSKNDAGGNSHNKTSFLDLNGDGYPDIVSGNIIQYTNTNGGFSGEKYNGMGGECGTNYSVQYGTGGSALHSFSVGTHSGNDNSEAVENDMTAESAKNMTIGFNSGINFSTNTDYTNEAFIDVNGDGLPDKVYDNGTARINLGYSFSSPISWGIDSIQKTQSLRIDPEAGLSLPFSIDKNASSFAAGVGISTMGSKGLYDVIDINGDGLPDAIHKTNDSIIVAINLGCSFATPTLWQNISEIKKSTSTSESVNAAFTIGIPIITSGLKMAISAGANFGHSMSRPRFELKDIDGDGFIDILESNSESELRVKRSKIARTNKLKTVTNSLGGKFTLDYKHNTPTYGLPFGKWVMSSVEVDYGIHGDYEIPNTKNVFEYRNGRRDRHEREFLGFGQVITKNINTQHDMSLYRRTVEEYDVSNIYSAGNLLRTCVAGSTGAKLVEEESEYYRFGLTNTASGGVNGGQYSFDSGFHPRNDRGAAYCPLKYTKSVRYEDGQEGAIMSESWSAYHTNPGDHGLLSDYRYSDKGTLGSDGTGGCDYITAIDYSSTLTGGSYYFGQPKNVIVSKGDELFHCVSATYSSAIPTEVTSIRRALEFREGGNGIQPASGPDTHGSASGLAVSCDFAETEYSYDPCGNLKGVRLPRPSSSDTTRVWYRYEYDNVLNTHLRKITDAFGLSNVSDSLDLRYGVFRQSQDRNNQYSWTSYDDLGRMTGVRTPFDESYGNTVSFSYKPIAETSNGTITTPAYSVTTYYFRNYAITGADGYDFTDSMRVVTFVDGFGRPIQLRRDGVVWNGSENVDSVIVTGRTAYDCYGRAVGSYYPSTADPLSLTDFTPGDQSGEYCTLTEYDELDRPLTVTLPDNTSTTYEYALERGSAYEGNALKTTVTDAEGNSSAMVVNGSGRTVKSIRHKGGPGSEALTTAFAYDGIGRLISVTDTEGNVTASTYDYGDRRTRVVHPASGETTYTYDRMGNVLTLQSANLRDTVEDRHVDYAYDRGRPTSVLYPEHPESNVYYHYGDSVDPDVYLRGRLKFVEDGSGGTEYHYDAMGNVNRMLRTLVVPGEMVATAEFRWKYDSFGKLIDMTYPAIRSSHGERVTYRYDRSGQLQGVYNGNTQGYSYVQEIGYDRFGSQVHMKYGNGSSTDYAYVPDNRRLHNISVSSPSSSSSPFTFGRTYGYDNVGNIVSLTSSPECQGTLFPPVRHEYTYDSLYRLVRSKGYTVNGGQMSAIDSLTMAYDDMYRITGKTLAMSQTGIQFTGTLSAGYSLAYSYSGDPGRRFQMSDVSDVNYRVADATVGSQDRVNERHTYEYDSNGNITRVSTSRKRADRVHRDNTREERFRWDEENRLLALSQDGYVSHYFYDASGERTVKMHGGNAAVFVNGRMNDRKTAALSFSAYFNPYFSIHDGTRFTKHLYIGSERVASVTGELDTDYGDVVNNNIEPAGVNVHVYANDLHITYEDRCAAMRDSIEGNYAYFKLPSGLDWSGTQPRSLSLPCHGDGAEAGGGPTLRGQGGGAGNAYPQNYGMIWYFHKDHLGSTTLVTDGGGSISQQVEYLPYGEVFLERQRQASDYLSPYRFNGKELDEETGLYYYGARYMNPRLSIWYGTDPMELDYPYSSSYTCTMCNPVRLMDYNGEDNWDVVAGYTIGTITNIIPGTSSWRDLYQPTNRTDYNNALQRTDIAAITVGAGMIGAGSSGVGAGTALVASGGAVSVSGVGAPAGGVAAASGVVVATGSEALIAGGTIMSCNALGNKEAGYDRGRKQVEANHNKPSSKTNNKISFIQGQGSKSKTVTTNIPKGYRKVKTRSQGQPIFTNGKNYITPDKTGHNGGVWKMGKTIKDLGKKETRMGTYDANLKRIGD